MFSFNYGHLKIRETMSVIYDEIFDFSTKFDAFKYQAEAVDAMKDLEYGAIFHEQGLGKTKIAIDILLYWLEKGIDTVIIVTKKTLVLNWMSEFQAHTSLIPDILSSKKGDNFFVFNSPTRVIVTNFETVSSEKERLKLFLQTRNVGIIIDESTKIKNPESKLTKDFFELSSYFKRRIIMTGTPVANRPYDIWSQIYFLDSGKSLGEDFNSFKKECDLSNDLGYSDKKVIAFEKSVASIFDKIRLFSVRETKNSGIISLPDKHIHTILVPFEREQKRMYDAVRKEMELSVVKGDNTILDESPEAIKRLLRLVQICSNPALLDDSYKEISAKENKLDVLIQKILEFGDNVIVWSIFTDNIDRFALKYKSIGAVKITGKMNMDARNHSVNSFKYGDSRVLFATPQSAKEGLTLTNANHAIFYDRGFNLDDYLQAQDRIHRLSQTKDCHIYNLIVEDSIDKWIDILLYAKQQAAFLAQGDTTISEYHKAADYSFSRLIRDILNIEQ